MSSSRKIVLYKSTLGIGSHFSFTLFYTVHYCPTVMLHVLFGVCLFIVTGYFYFLFILPVRPTACLFEQVKIHIYTCESSTCMSILLCVTVTFMLS